ncbi:hypothetical protein HZU75_02310 [Chitinibacter fontanus]|uniref:Uncharacterized protein n=1 Tax=Chitinibacter fontanus TaxID=1737446 RepID=A0A7D5ZBT5_9NEIS|nr:hypothetical protein [Chitinibacter fontanus]QLI80464.1 hypothetical protein HZU75_02310 [Chitinibacter fontanus]
MDIFHPPAKEPRKFTNPILREAEQKIEMEKTLRARDELAFRIEMALMSGMSRELDKHREQSDALPFFLRHLVRDLGRFNQKSPRAAALLKERLIQGTQPQDQTGSFKVSLAADETIHLTSLAVR